MDLTPGKRYRISIPDRPAVEGTCISVWRRADNPQPVMSISSGMKDQTHNYGCMALSAVPAADAVSMLHLSGHKNPAHKRDPRHIERCPMPVMLYRINGAWMDREGTRATISET